PGPAQPGRVVQVAVAGGELVLPEVRGRFARADHSQLAVTVSQGGECGGPAAGARSSPEHRDDPVVQDSDQLLPGRRVDEPPFDVVPALQGDGGHMPGLLAPRPDADLVAEDLVAAE